ncbi:MAG: PqqD family protein [Clostridia bacterium]|nr:PqqD family protein [Clostridia bacterium]
MENKKYRLKPGYVLREIAGEHLAIPVTAENSTDIVVLNPVSALLWEALETEKTIEELAQIVCNNFDIDRDEAKTDITEFIESLVEKGVVI